MWNSWERKEKELLQNFTLSSQIYVVAASKKLKKDSFQRISEECLTVEELLLKTNFCCNDAFPLLHSPLRVLMLASFCAAL